MSTNTDKPQTETRPDVPGGRCYWCASQDHDSDGCVEAQRIMDEQHRLHFPEEYAPAASQPPAGDAGEAAFYKWYRSVPWGPTGNHLAGARSAWIELSRRQREAEVGLRDALEELMSWQNGSPLPSYDKGWTAAMEKARAALAGGEKPRNAEKLPTLEDIHKLGVDITGGEDAADYICRQRAGESSAAGLRDKNERLRQSAEILKQQVSEERDRAEVLARDRWQKTQALQHVAEWMEKHTGHPRELEGCVRAALGH